MQVIKRDGSKEPFDKKKLSRAIERACKGLEGLELDEIVEETFSQAYDGMPTKEMDRVATLVARSRIFYEPNYSYAAARILLNSLYREAFGFRVKMGSLEQDYKKVFINNLFSLTEAGRLDERLCKIFDLRFLADALKPERDLRFKYLGIQTLYDRYFIHLDGRRMEIPQAFWMRVAMGLCLNEKQPEIAAIEAYELFSTFRYCPATPTLFNSATQRPQLSSCYLSTMEDSIDGIYGTLHQLARLSKYAGGLGTDVTPLRGTGSYIKGTNGKSQGLIPWLRQHNDLVIAVNQGGSRPGAEAVYLENWHIDYPEFLELKKNTGDERRRCHDLHTASWISDLFMKKVIQDTDWYLFSPDEVPGLHEAFGEAFENLYEKAIERAKVGDIKNFRVTKAKDLWKKMLTAIKETGHPWITFKDPSNIRYSDKHIGSVLSSNLCTEILRHSIPTTYQNMEVVNRGETAVCNLGSINLSEHVSEDGEIEWKKLEDSVNKAIRLLDNVIDENYYPTPESKNSNLKNRPVGLGIMGWADLLHKKKLSFDSDDAVALAEKVQRFISFAAISQSCKLAQERGSYPNFAGSTWSKGQMPIDTLKQLKSFRDQESDETPPEWVMLGESVKMFGMRNGNVMAIAPTATISYIVGCSQSIEPNYSPMYVYSTLSGEFTMINDFFVREMKAAGLWNKEFAENLKAIDGDVFKLELPQEVRDRFKTAFDVDQFKLIDAAAARQKWIDMGQSLNLYFAGNSMKKLSELYMYAWKEELKTTYYLHTKAASRLEKSTTAATCNIGGDCQSCQ